MKPKMPEIKVRVAGDKYLEVPEGHRTTFIVGALDMLCMTYVYVAPEHRPRIDAMIRYAGQFKSDALRLQFDAYMRADSDREKHGAASSFFVALNTWSGFDK